jgi:L-seryl-tRNA(Ser) seleniumtransferase
MKKRADDTSPRPLTSPRDLPSVEALVRDRALDGARTIYGAAFVTDEARAVLEEAREALRKGNGRIDAEDLPRRVLSRMEALLAGGIRPVINATGTVLHTNLGRSILADEAVCKAALAGSTYTDLEFDIGRGARGERDAFSVSLIKRLTGCEEASVVNNNAAALLITLNTLAEGREVIISRGELIEIGGSFRLPEIIEKSGCVLREVGTTNRTHATDYIGAINERTALILKVHTSNYTIEGFTSEVGLPELVAIGKEHGIPVVEDLGAGALVDLAAYGLPREPLVSESIRTGAQTVTFSGDKLLGGPQAGLIAGKRETVARIRKNPLKRALRCGKLTLAALEETLKLYLNPGRLAEGLPSLGLMTRSIEEIEAMAKRAAALINADKAAGISASVRDGRSVIGGGSLPGQTLPTRVVSMDSEAGAAALQRAFLDADPPVIGRIHKDAFILDPRTVLDEEEFFDALRETLEKLASL